MRTMKQMRRVIAGAFSAAALVLMMSFWTGAMAGPQPLPEAACNQGTTHANHLAQDWDTVAHYHDFDEDGIEACYHFNPTAGPGSE